MVALTTILIAVCYIWITRDSWMQEAFAVYGRAFRTAVQMKAWGIMYRCGWRLCILVATICTTLWFAFDATVLRGNETTTSAKVAWAVLAASAAAIVPWRFAVVAIQRRREIDSLVNDLTGTADRIGSTCDMNTTFAPAGYDNAGDWSAWHPSHGEFEAGDDSSIWRRVVPVFYTSPTHPGTVVIPIDWSNFAVWGAITAVPRIGEHLPFRGPGQTGFRLRSIRQPKSGSSCSMLLCADMDFTDENTAGNNGLDAEASKASFENG